MELYYENRKKHNLDKYLLLFLLLIIIILIFVIIIKLDVVNEKENVVKNTKTEYVTEKLSTNNEESVENKEEKIKKSINCTVGISKLKNPSKTILLAEEKNLVGLGSGVIISSKGYILTNQHVVGNKYSNCYVTLENGLNYDGIVVWADSNIDLAIVKINVGEVESIKFGDSDKITLAEEVYAIGNPIGMEFERTITKGIISGINRTIKLEENEEETYMEDLLQTDATINEGNSGGPLVNSNGELIGINTVKLSNAQGIGFAVPINIVKPIVERLENENEFKEAYLGIYGLDKEVTKYLESNLSILSGIYIVSIKSDSVLKNLDIKEGDIINKIDNLSVNKMNELKKYIYSKKPGDEISIEYTRNNSENKNIKVKLIEKASF